MYEFAPLSITAAFVGPPFVLSPFHTAYTVNLVTGRPVVRGLSPIRLSC
jgi:hypothetical protein